jgi:hypothetical protein
MPGKYDPVKAEALVPCFIVDRYLSVHQIHNLSRTSIALQWQSVETAENVTLRKDSLGFILDKKISSSALIQCSAAMFTLRGPWTSLTAVK